MSCCEGEEFHRKDCPVAKALRGSWCTPRWLAKLIGRVDLDPCTNGRSNINAIIPCDLAHGGDGLHKEGTPGWFKSNLTRIIDKAPAWFKVFINPPYGPGEVVRWVKHYRHTRFIFLLRWDPSTDWFRELYPHCTHVWFPAARIGFEPPPRIKASSNPFPHALYLRDPSPELLERLRGAGYVLDTRAGQHHDADHEHCRDGRDDGAGSSGPHAPRAGGPAGGDPWDAKCSTCSAPLRDFCECSA